MERYLNKKTALFLQTLVSFFLAWNRTINLLYAMFALLVATLVLSYFLPRRALRGVSALRTLPAAAFEGDEIEVTVQLKNAGWTPRYMIEVLDAIPAAEPALRRPMTFVARLAGRSAREYSYPVPCYKRGAYRIGPLSLRSAYPLGIRAAEKVLPGGQLDLLVYPKTFEIPVFPLAGAQLTLSGVEALSKAGGSQEFFGTREYKQGDSLKHIHWPSTARHGNLIVKEFEQRASTEVTLLLDLHRDSLFGEGRETTLEYAVKIAASIGKYALEKGHNVQLIGFGKSHQIVPSSRGPSHLGALLEILARVESDGVHSFPSALSQAADLLREGGTAVVLFCRADDNWEAFSYAFGLLRVKHIQPICVFIDHESFTSAEGRSRFKRNPMADGILAAGITSYVVSKGDDLSEIFSV
jgi:uncharacterized protein (DUF58 family)